MPRARCRTRVFVGSAFLLLATAGWAQAAADLAVVVTAPSGVKPGQTLVYTIVVSNIGDADATAVTLDDATPAGLTFVSSDCAGASFPCTLGTIAAGQGQTITASYNVPTGYNGANPILDSATASSTPADGTPGNNTGQAATAVTQVAGFYSLPPCRVIDTRGTAGVPIGGPALQGGMARTFDVREACGLPGNAIAVSYNVTVTGPTSAGDLRIFPGGSSPPLASAINYVSGQTRANNGIVPLSGGGTLGLQCDQASGTTHLILDVNGYFASTDEVATPAGANVHIRPAPEVALTFDNVTTAGLTSSLIVEFPDNRTGAVDQDLKAFFPPSSPLHALLPSAIVPSFVTPLGKGGPAGPPTFLLALIDTTARFARTAEFHGLEDFRLGWDPPCVDVADPTQEPRTFYAREAPKGEPALVEETGFGGPVFVDISSGCGSNKGSGWNFSLYLTARDSRTPINIASYMLTEAQNALSQLGGFITDPTVASGLLTDLQNAAASLATAPATSVVSVNHFMGLVDGNPAAFVNTTRNVSGELVARALSANYMLEKLIPTGTIVEFAIPTPSSFPFAITKGPDGNLWFAERDGQKIGRITPAGSMVEFTLPSAGPHQSIVIHSGSDGNLWFTEFDPAANKVGRITPAGVITEFPLPLANSFPYGITLGPDGNMWFTESNTNRVGRITPAGVVTELPVSAGGNVEITTGPDGNLWYCEGTANKIARLTTSGVLTEFAIPTPGSTPHGITKGPDGSLWFAEQNGNKIGRISTGGVITEFALPSSGARPSGITAGADGNLWFTENNINQIGRMTTAGVVTEFPLPIGASGPWEITLGPDNQLWFTEFNGNRIGRISP
jgi:uncharacterized repeat protein (TIGR01451 family)